MRRPTKRGVYNLARRARVQLFSEGEESEHAGLGMSVNTLIRNLEAVPDASSVLEPPLDDLETPLEGAAAYIEKQKARAAEAAAAGEKAEVKLTPALTLNPNPRPAAPRARPCPRGASLSS